MRRKHNNAPITKISPTHRSLGGLAPQLHITTWVSADGTGNILQFLDRIWQTFQI
jgi:hypothetical protein